MRRRTTCPVPGCGLRIEHWQRLCAAHYARLPADLRAAIRAARIERRTLDLSRLTGAAALWLHQHAPAAEAARRQGEV